MTNPNLLAAHNLDCQQPYTIPFDNLKTPCPMRRRQIRLECKLPNHRRRHVVKTILIFFYIYEMNNLILLVSCQAYLITINVVCI